MTAVISPQGLELDLDIDQVDSSFKGHLSLEYKATIPEDVLSRLPTRTLAFDVAVSYVLRAVGVPASRRG